MKHMINMYILFKDKDIQFETNKSINTNIYI